MLNLNIIVGGSIGTNSYLLEEKNKVLLIDFVPEIEDLINQSKFIIDKILLTHIHFDHFEDLSNFQKKYSFELYLSNEAYNSLKNPDYSILSIFPPEIINNINNLNLNNIKICRDNDIINWNNHKIKVIKSPGHSSDSLMYIMDENKSVFTGDTVFRGSVGRTDLPGGDFNMLIKSIDKLFSLVENDYLLYPGHGPKTSVDFEKKHNPFLKTDNY